MRKGLTVQEREEEDRLYAELKRRRQDSKESGDDKAKWVRRRGWEVNIGNYEVEEEEKASQADRGPQVEGEETDWTTKTHVYKVYITTKLHLLTPL